tara:strand:- start:41 stop:1081 length:1041 start_codon:yes stop_codon:yes gene_type:complete
VIRFLFILLISLSLTLRGQENHITDFAQTITKQELMELLYIYASDYFEGRKTGSKGQKIAVDFLRYHYMNLNIQAAQGTNNYFQEMTLKVDGKMVSTENVAAIIEGSEFPDEYIILTSHLDHIGIEGGQINNGADDDGSGTVTMLEIAEALQIGLENGFRPKRSIVFLHVTGEEEGLLGSAYYTENPLYPMAQTIVNLNIDMIGRNDLLHESDEEYLYLIGSDILSQDLHDISISINKRYSNLDLDFRYNDPLLKVYERGRYYANEYYYRSDHYNFAKNDIPVIFYFSGTHEDYHLPTDTVEKINYPLLTKRARFIFHTLWELANMEDRIRLNSKKKNLNIDKNGR